MSTTTSLDAARAPSRRPTRSLRLAALALVAGLACAVVGVTAVQAAPPTTDPATGAEYGARWLAAQVNSDGFVPLANADPNESLTIQTAIALATAEVEEPTFERMVDWLAANVADVIANEGVAGNDPGRIGGLLVVVDAAGGDPSSFGGADLPALLADTLGDYEPGLYGATDPTYDGAYRQSLAIVGLVAAGGTPAAAAVDWLVAQQCDDATPSADGGWQAYRADLGVGCGAPDPVNFTGPDTNSTALAIQALAAVDVTGGLVRAGDFLDRAQAADGGFPFVSGGDTDPNSTALVILAIVALNEDPTAGRWVAGTATPYSSLLSWQLGCDAPAADRGSFASPFSAGLPDLVASTQAVWGAAGNALPLAGPVTFTVGAEPCVATTTTTTAAPTTTTAGGGSPSTTPPGSVAAVPVAAAPRFAG